MAVVRPQDVLVRVGGRVLARHGVVAVAGAGRSMRELVETFSRADATTCAPYLDRDGKLRVAAANKLRIDYTPFVADGLTFPDGSAACGPSLMRSRTNLVTWSDALTNWTSSGTPLATGDFVTLGDLSLTLLEDDDAGVAEDKRIAVTFTGDGVKPLLFYIRAPATPADGDLARVDILDNTTATVRARIGFTWNADGTMATATAITGVLLGTKRLGKDSGGFYVYAVYMQTTAVTAANSNIIRAAPGGFTASNVGKMVVGGFHVGDELWPPLHRTKTTGATKTHVSDALSLPVNFGPIDCTVLSHYYRPVWADVSGDLGIFPRFWRIGTSAPGIHQQFVDSTRSMRSQIDTSGTDATQNVALPAGAALVAIAQFKDLTVGGLTAIDLGSGLSAFAGPASPFSAFGNQTLAMGLVGGQSFDGIALDLAVLRGLRTRPEAMAIL